MVAGSHALLDEVVSELAHLGVDLGVRVVLVLVADVGLVAVGGGHLPQHSHRGRCRVEHPHGDATHVDGGHVEGRTRGFEFGTGGLVVVDHGGDGGRTEVTGATRGAAD